MQGDVLSVERVIAAPPEAIFSVVADASRHPEIDGSGTVKQVKPGAPKQLGPGVTFGMAMRMGVPYSMVNTVVEFEKDRRIAWQARMPGLLGALVGGRIWRYELEPRDGGTLVRESWDLSQDRQRQLLKLGKLPEVTRRNMERTLERLDRLVAGER
ncbi:MAG: SRPBCC family protein [Actinomycetota bacterium]|jgi:uncharacterized protein YndB with AHSA1/START domain|nr:SRPBCC family protein [Actinomycetota bacterium]